MRRAIISACLVAASAAGVAHAWSVDTCDGKVVGMRTARSFVADRCNITVGGARDADVNYAFNEFNRIVGVAHRFNVAEGDSDCVIETDDAIAFVTRASIDGLSGLTSWTDKRCAVLADNDGRRIDIRIRIASDLTLGADTEDRLGQSARTVLLHEMGHALGGKHDVGRPNMMYDPGNGSLRVGSRSAGGTLMNNTTSYMPDDLDFAQRWHGEAGGGNDVAMSRQFWNGSSVVNFMNDSVSTMCPGQQYFYGFTTLNKGKNNIATVAAWIVLSSNTTISTADTAVQSWNINLPLGTFVNPINSFAVPALAPGDYHLGAIVDPQGLISETDEHNNSVKLGPIVRIPSGC